jgi:WD40 repeat protein
LFLPSLSNTLYYALDASKHNPLIISGGSDQKICLWDLNDYCSTLLTTAHVEARAALGAQSGLHASGVTSANVGSPARGATPPAAPSKRHIERLLSPRIIFSGHTAQVEEVCFHPLHQELLCSVGDDKRLLVWDMRLGGSKAALKLWTTHTDDVNAVHWNTVNDNLLVTGSSDHTVKVLDLRRVCSGESFTKRYISHAPSLRSAAASMGENAAGTAAVVHTFEGHRGNVTNVQWHSNGDYFASGSDDGDLCIWSIRGIEELQMPVPPSSTPAKVVSEAVGSMDTTGDGASAPPPTITGGLPPKSLWDGSDGQPAHLLFRHTGHRTAVVNFAWNPFVKDGQY